MDIYVFILRLKSTGRHSWEHHIILARGDKHLKELAELEGLDLADYDIELKDEVGLVYSSIY